MNAPDFDTACSHAEDALAERAALEVSDAVMAAVPEDCPREALALFNREGIEAGIVRALGACFRSVREKLLRAAATEDPGQLAALAQIAGRSTAEALASTLGESLSDVQRAVLALEVEAVMTRACTQLLEAYAAIARRPGA